MSVCTLEATKDSFTFKASNTSKDMPIHSTIAYNKDQCTLDVKQACASSFSLDVWLKAIDLALLSPMVTLCLAPGYPVEMQTLFPTLGRISFFIAPLQE
jgi:hypothetical protein